MQTHVHRKYGNIGRRAGNKNLFLLIFTCLPDKVASSIFVVCYCHYLPPRYMLFAISHCWRLTMEVRERISCVCARSQIANEKFNFRMFCKLSFSFHFAYSMVLRVLLGFSASALQINSKCNNKNLEFPFA